MVILGTWRRLTVIVAAMLMCSGLGAPVARAAESPNGVEDGLVLWLDASDPHADGTQPEDGDRIRRWIDKSSAHNNAIAIDRSARYTAQVGALNDRPALQFFRENDNVGSKFYVMGLDIRAVTRPDLTVFTVYQPLANEPNNGLWGNDNLEWDRFFLSYHPSFGDGVNDGLVSLGPTLAGETIPDAGDTSVAHLMTVGYDGEIDSHGVNVGKENGSYVYTDCQVQRRFTDSSDATNAQMNFIIGADGDNSVYDGYIAELIVYERALTDEELSYVYMYLSTKYELGSACADYVGRTTTTTTSTDLSTTEPEILANTGSKGGTWFSVTMLCLLAGGIGLVATRRRVIR